MSNLIAQNKFAELCGVSAPAISKAIKQQRLKKVGTKIDLDCDLSKSYLKNQQESTPAPANKTGTKTGKKKKQPAGQPPPAAEDGGPLQLSLDLTDRQLLLFQKVEIEKLYKIEQAKEKKFNRGVARGKYIKREFVETVFAKIHSIDTDEFKAMENRLTPGICGVFKKGEDSIEATEIKKMLNEEIAKALKSVQRTLHDFLSAQKQANDK